MTEYLKLLKTCQKCRSKQSCINVCLNKECIEEYGALICLKCHEKTHKKGVVNSVKLDELIQDFEEVFKDNQINKGKVSLLIDQNITKIDELMEDLQNMKYQMLNLSEIIKQHNHVEFIFNQVKSKKNFDIINKSTKQLLRSCIYDLEQSPKIKFMLNGDSDIDYLIQFPQLIKQSIIANKKLQKLSRIQNLSESQIIQEDANELSDQNEEFFEDNLNFEFIQNNSLISEIKLKSPRYDEFSQISEIFEKIEELKAISLKEINEKFRLKNVPYKWDDFNNIDMHLSSRNVPGFINCTITDNGFDYLWVRGGHWYASKTQNTRYGLLDIVEYWTKQKSLIDRLQSKTTSPEKNF